MSETSQIRKTFKHSFIYSLASLLQKAVGFLMLPIYANYLQSKGYGIVAMLDVIVAFMSVVVGYGITGGVQRFYFTKSSDADRSVLVSTGILLMAIVVIAVTIPALLLSRPLAYLLIGNQERGWVYVFLAILTFAADMSSASASCYMLIKEQSKLYSCLSFTKFLFGLLFNIYFIVVLKLGVLGLLYSNLLAAFLYSVVVHVHAIRQVGIKYNKNDAKDILRYSLPMIPGCFSMLVRNDADKVILRMFMGLSQLGAYMMLLNFSSLISVLILQPFLNIWNVKQFEICEAEDGPAVMARVFTLQLALMLFLGLVLSVEVPLIIKVIAPQDFWVPGIFVFLAVFSRILFASYYNLAFGLAYAKLTGKISKIQFIMSIVSVILNFILIKYFSLVGALISSCIVYLLQAIMTYFMADKYYHIPFEWRKITGITCLTVILYIMIDSYSLTKFDFSFHLQPISSIISNISDYQTPLGMFFIKVVSCVSTNLITIFEGFIKLFMTLIFIVGLLLLGIVSRQNILQPFTGIFRRSKIKTVKIT